MTFTTITTVLPIWSAQRGRFTKNIEALHERDLRLKLGESSIHSLLYHTAEVEYMFAEWFFGKKKPEMVSLTSSSTMQDLIELLAHSNVWFVEAMKGLQDEQWHVPIESPMGSSSPLEAVGRLMYHTGMHAGQITLIRKNGSLE